MQRRMNTMGNTPTFTNNQLENAEAVQQFNNHETDNVYFNVIMDHTNINWTQLPNGSPSSQTPEDANYQVTRDIPLLDKASDYYVAVVRFAIPLDSVPVMVMEIVPNQNNPNLTPYIIGITYNATNYPNQLIYSADNNLVPPVQNQENQVITPYYFIYAYNAFIDMINASLSQTWSSSGLAGIFPNSIPPYFIYDTVGLTLIVPDCFRRVVSPLTNIPTIYVNSALESFLSSFQYYSLGTNQPFGKDEEFILSPNRGDIVLSNVKPYYPAGITPPATTASPNIATDYWSITSEYNTFQLWDSLRKIVIISNTMPVRTEGIPSANPASPGLSSGLPILSDFVLDLQQAGDSRSIAHYNPQTYKLVDLVSDLPLTKIDIQLFWQDRNQNLYPIKLSSFQTASIKLGFFRKNIYKNFRENYGGLKY